MQGYPNGDPLTDGNEETHDNLSQGVAYRHQGEAGQEGEEEEEAEEEGRAGGDCRGPHLELPLLHLRLLHGPGFPRSPSFMAILPHLPRCIPEKQVKNFLFVEWAGAHAGEETLSLHEHINSLDDMNL